MVVPGCYRNRFPVAIAAVCYIGTCPNAVCCIFTRDWHICLENVGLAVPCRHCSSWADLDCLWNVNFLLKAWENCPIATRNATRRMKFRCWPKWPPHFQVNVSFCVLCAWWDILTRKGVYVGVADGPCHWLIWWLGANVIHVPVGVIFAMKYRYLIGDGCCTWLHLVWCIISVCGMCISRWWLLSDGVLLSWQPYDHTMVLIMHTHTRCDHPYWELSGCAGNGVGEGFG